MFPTSFGIRKEPRRAGSCTRLTFAYTGLRGGCGCSIDEQSEDDLLLAAGLLLAGMAPAEVCTTQSQMTATERDAMAAAAKGFAAQVQSNDAAGLRTASVAELAKDFNGLEYVVGNLSPKLKGGTLQVEQVYLLDGSDLKGALARCRMRSFSVR